MNRTSRFSITSICFGTYLSLATSLSYAETPTTEQTSQLTGLTISSIVILLLFSGVFLSCIRKLINDRNKLKEHFYQLRSKNDELLDQKHQYLERETEILNRNLELDKRLTARTETVNKVNHELTKALESLHLQNQTINSLNTALKFSHQNIIIIDKHYRVCFASQQFLDFTGLNLVDIQNQPLKRLEKHVCLPEMNSNGLTLNKDGLIDTQLKCIDKEGETYSVDARIALSCSELKEILHYVIIFDEGTQKEPS